ncbi:TPA: helix-turn-helix domain-containing protein [Klebsiella pneumoniae]
MLYTAKVFQVSCSESWAESAANFESMESCRRMLENGSTRQQVADVIGVGVKAIYKYFPRWMMFTFTEW